MNESLSTNELQISIASMNGDYSVSTNDTFARALFRLGFCVSTKRNYPSNIKGAPTRYLIRTSGNNFQSAADSCDIALVLFAEKAKKEIEELKSGGLLIYDGSTTFGEKITAIVDEEDSVSPFYRDDINYYDVPFTRLARENFSEKKLRQIARNMVYIGVLSGIFKLDLKKIEKTFTENFCEKGELIVDCNLKALSLGYKYVQANSLAQEFNLSPQDDSNEGRLFMKGNDASALGAVMGGCNYVSWYPITPATSHGENLERYSQKYPIIVEQAENEDSCLGRALGAAWAGVRSSVSSSGPGLSNMAEFIGYSSFAEIPVVIFDVQRMGPATGLPTHNKQGDLRYLIHAGHDESPRIILTPSTVEELFDFSRRAFDLADKYQLPVIVVSELALGEFFYTVERFDYPEEPLQRGKLLSDRQLAALKDYQRFADVDDDGVCWRTLPGQGTTYTVRGAYHDRSGRLSEEPADCAEKIRRLFKKLETLKKSGDLPKPTVETREGEPGFISFGSSVYTIFEARKKLADRGLESGLFVIPVLNPLPAEQLQKFIATHENIYVVEQNYSGQLLSLLKEQVGHYRYFPIRKYDGELLRPAEITRVVEENETDGRL